MFLLLVAQIMLAKQVICLTFGKLYMTLYLPDKHQFYCKGLCRQVDTNTL